MKESIKILKEILDKRQKRNIVILFVLILFGAGLESLGVSSVLPLVSVIVTDDFTSQYPIIKDICIKLNIQGQTEFLIFMMSVMIIIFIVKEIYMVFLSYFQYRFIFNGQVKSTTELFSKFMRRDYEFFLNSNYNYISKIVRHDVVDEYNMLLYMVKFMTEAVVFLILSALLFVIDAKMALLIVLLVMAVVVIIFAVVKPTMKKSGDAARKYVVLSEKWMYQGINGIKDVKISQKEDFFVKNYNKYQSKYASSQRMKALVGEFPTYIIEGICITGVLSYMIVLIVRGVDISALLPQISAFAVAAIRLLPSANRMNGYMNSITYFKSLLKDLDVQFEAFKSSNINTKDEKAGLSNERKVTFEDRIELKNVTFSYQASDKNILEHSDMIIPKGKSVAVVGASGAGKTTAIDVLLGLLKPQEGDVLVDGENINADMKSWLGMVGYIPQTIYLTDDTIRNNVAFGVDDNDIDDNRVWEVLSEAQLTEFVKELPDGINTEIGDRGVRLSGGQRQRLGIARALYNNPEVLLFDEATSALDTETESAIMDSINSFKGKKTMIIIAHRLATVENCDIQYRVVDGRIEKEK